MFMIYSMLTPSSWTELSGDTGGPLCVCVSEGDLVQPDRLSLPLCAPLSHLLSLWNFTEGTRRNFSVCSVAQDLSVALGYEEVQCRPNKPLGKRRTSGKQSVYTGRKSSVDPGSAQWVGCLHVLFLVPLRTCRAALHDHRPQDDQISPVGLCSLQLLWFKKWCPRSNVNGADTWNVVSWHFTCRNGERRKHSHLQVFFCLLL